VLKSNKAIDMTNKRFGKLVVTMQAPSNKNGNAMWYCICDCGNVTISKGVDLRRNRIKSCGCSRKRGKNYVYE